MVASGNWQQQRLYGNAVHSKFCVGWTTYSQRTNRHCLRKGRIDSGDGNIGVTNMSDEYVAYKTPATVVSETVYHFLRGSIYGAAFGLVRIRHRLLPGITWTRCA